MRTASVNLSDAIDQYLNSLTARHMAPNTIRATKYTLKRALAIWGNLTVQHIGGRHVDRLFAEAQWAERTHNTNLQILKAFFAWCRAQGYMAINMDPAFGWRNRRVPAVERLRVPVEEFPALLDAATHPRDRAVISVGLFLMVRSSEARGITIQDVDFGRNLVRVYREKTKEEDWLPMCSELREELVRYLNYYRAQQGTLHPSWFLLPARKFGEYQRDERGRIRAAGITMVPTRRLTHPYEIVQEALAKLGYDIKQEGGHTLRRSGARALADQLRVEGYDGALLRVASMLGHKSTRVTEVYIGWHLEKQQRNEQFAGKPMFPGMHADAGRMLRIAEER